MASPARTPAGQQSLPRGGASPLSPARISRLQEKQELQQLNDRLAAYIDAVRRLESENGALQLQVLEREETRSRELTGLKALYETELADARTALDEMARERARLQLELGQMKREHEQLQHTCMKKNAELASAQARLTEAEALLNSKEASLNTAVSERKALESTVTDLQLHIQEVHLYLHHHQSDFMETRMSACGGQEMKDTRRRLETRLVEVDSGRQVEYEFKLAAALADMRQQHDEQVQVYKDEMEQTYTAKLENVRLSSEMNSSSASMAREELRESSLRVESLAAQLANLQKQVRRYTTDGFPARPLTRFHTLASSSSACPLMQQTLNLFQIHLCCLVRDWRFNGCSVSVRLKLSPSPSARVTVSRASSSRSVRTARGKRKRVDVEESEASSSVSIAHSASATGNVCIDELDVDGNFIRLHNSSEQDQPMAGFQLTRTIGDVSATYKFTAKYVLKAGQKVTIWASNAGVSSNPPTDLIWKSQSSWGSGKNIKVLLLSPGGEVRRSPALLRMFIIPLIIETLVFTWPGDPHTSKRGCAIM
uniref:Lamin B1 n=1 Tax=Sinocyclocheilus rhinocerous TaxID=307959 RepID=A0A673JUJ1_9TELE